MRGAYVDHRLAPTVHRQLEANYLRDRITNALYGCVKILSRP